MSQVRIEAFVSVPPCSGGVAVKRLLKQIEGEFGDQVDIGPGFIEDDAIDMTHILPDKRGEWCKARACVL